MVTLCQGNRPMTNEERLEEKEKLKLISVIATNNMFLLDSNGELKRYASEKESKKLK